MPKLEKYDKIGIGYNRTRKADPFLAGRLYHHLNPVKNGHYLDVGCGTGNYTIALHQKGVRFTGLDPSERMLEIASARCDTVDWKTGKAEALPLPDESMDGAVISLSIHHWADLDQGFRELYRVIKPTGRMVLFTSTPQQMKGYWLNHYFPKMLEDSIRQMPALEKVESAIHRAGFSIEKKEKYFIRQDLEDLFLYCGKHEPVLYLNPEIRNGISSFSDLANREEVEAGLKKLEKDINSGHIEPIIRQYENNAGDYIFVVGSKKGWKYQ